MPLYSFRCDICNMVVDKFLKMDDRDKPLSEPCESCQSEGHVYRVFDTQGFVDPGIIKADKNMERSGVLDELNRIKKHHPYMKWKG